VAGFLTLADEDDGKLFRVRVINTGEVRIARYHRFTLAGRPSSPRALPTPITPRTTGAGYIQGGARRPSAGFVASNQGQRMTRVEQAVRDDTQAQAIRFQIERLVA
jgi:hypothetical protein